MPIDRQQLDKTIVQLQERLESQFINGEYCVGELSTSALSTAVSCISLREVDHVAYQKEVSEAQTWLMNHTNQDGGWGDTVASPSNISTSLLGWSALEGREWEGLRDLEDYLKSQLIELSPEKIIQKLQSIYGDDKTFAVPICMALAICNRLGPDPECWKYVDALPFEFAAAPQGWYQHFKMSVVSYAIPALISIGLLKHTKQPSLPPMSWIRSMLTNRCLEKLKSVQPSNGGFLEAVPLTGFTTMALHRAGYKDHTVVQKALTFLLDSILNDGSSPIDTNLSCWVSSLSLQVLSELNSNLDLNAISHWLADKQWSHKDPYAGAAPGGWAWTPLPGGVPDADDTSGALLALMKTGPCELTKIKKGIQWLLNLQNSDGGIPTFCRGWGQLPFDQSCTDITAHALRAFDSFEKRFPKENLSTIKASKKKAIEFLKQQQRADGAWLPLWFGSQDHPNKENPVYGTSKVLLALDTVEHSSMVEAGLSFLSSVQKEDGSFGGHKDGKASIEETGLALTAMSYFSHAPEKCELAATWLINQCKGSGELKTSPIGLYFASLWYSEKMYPIIFGLEGLVAYRKNHI